MTKPSRPDTLEQILDAPPLPWPKVCVLLGVFLSASLFTYIGLMHLGRPVQPIGAGILVIILLTALSAWDARNFILPDVLTFSLILFGVFWHYWTGDPIMNSVFGALIGFAIFWGIDYAWKIAKGRNSIGRGDAKLLAGGGALCGVLGLPLIILVSSAVGLVGALFMRRTKTKEAVIPFGPFLAFAIWCVWNLNLN